MIKPIQLFTLTQPIQPIQCVQAIQKHKIPLIPNNNLQQDVFEKQTEQKQDIAFGAKWPKPDLKQLWDKGRLPSVKFGFYGDLLTKENISREHLKPASKGGRRFVTNIVLASKPKNNGRGNRDIRFYCIPDVAKQYLEQFKNIKIKGFDGNEYIRQIKLTLKKLGIEL